MKFIQDEKTVQCIRTSIKGGKKGEEVIVDFDARLDTIPPHVSGLLFAEENAALQAWLNERAQLQEELENKSFGITVLETLPNLLDNATNTLSSAGTIDKALFKRIKMSLMRLDLKLSNFHQLSEEDLTEFKVMEDEEVLKEQLESIRKKV